MPISAMFSGGAQRKNTFQHRSHLHDRHQWPLLDRHPEVSLTNNTHITLSFADESIFGAFF